MITKNIKVIVWARSNCLSPGGNSSPPSSRKSATAPSCSVELLPLGRFPSLQLSKETPLLLPSLSFPSHSWPHLIPTSFFPCHSPDSRSRDPPGSPLCSPKNAWQSAGYPLQALMMILTPEYSKLHPTEKTFPKVEALFYELLLSVRAQE